MRALLTKLSLLTCEKSCAHENTLVDGPRLVITTPDPVMLDSGAVTVKNIRNI